MSALNPNHPMTSFAQENAIKLIALMIWKLRKHCPNLEVRISAADMNELANVFNAEGQRGIVAVKGVDEGVVIQLIDQASGQALIVDPKMNENSPNAQRMRQMLAARERAPKLANRLRHDANLKTLGKDLAYQAAEALELLVWEPSE